MRLVINTVITADLVSSTSQKPGLNISEELRWVFRNLTTFLDPGTLVLPFEISRGDSFQGVLGGVKSSLLAALYLRCSIRQSLDLDVRQAIGIGTIEKIAGMSTGTSSGEAFLRSGRLLDAMNQRRFNSRLLVSTSDDAFDREFNALLTVFDAIVRRWTTRECEAVLLKLHNWNQTDIADYLQINQSAVHKRLKSADFYTVQLVLERWQSLSERLVDSTAIPED